MIGVKRKREVFRTLQRKNPPFSGWLDLKSKEREELKVLSLVTWE